MIRKLISFFFLLSVFSTTVIAQGEWKFNPGYYQFSSKYNDTLSKILRLQSKIDSLVRNIPEMAGMAPLRLTTIAAFLEADGQDSIRFNKVKIVLEDKNRDLKVYDLILKTVPSVPHHMLYLNLPEHTQLHLYTSSNSDVVYERLETDVLSDIRILSRFSDRSKNRWLKISLHSYIYTQDLSGDKYEDAGFMGWIKEGDLEIVPFVW